MRPVAHGNGHMRQTDIMNRAIDPLHLTPSDLTKINCGIPFIFWAELDGTTTSKSYSIPAGMKFRVIDAWAVMTGAGAASDAFNCTDGTNAIITPIDVSAASDKDIVRATTIDDARYEINGGTLALTNTSAAVGTLFVMVIRVA